MTPHMHESVESELRALLTTGATTFDGELTEMSVQPSSDGPQLVSTFAKKVNGKRCQSGVSTGKIPSNIDEANKTARIIIARQKEYWGDVLNNRYA